MDSMVFWPLLGVIAAMVAFVPAIQDSGYRSLTYWLIIPPVLAGIVAASAHLGGW